MSRYRDLVAAAKQRISEVTAAELLARLDDVVVLDVREADEHAQGAIPGARFLSRGILERDVETVIPDRKATVVLYCAAGNRSALAASTLAEMGYSDVSSLKGGFDSWKQSGMPWGDPTGLTADQRSRYARHVRLPEVGETGQIRLLGARVALVGAGGLGSPAALYLAAAGVGTIGVIDDDVVDQSNLQRQVLHNVDRVGTPKVDSARETLVALNPDVKVETHHERLMAANAMSLLSGYDVIVDGGDNFPTRYLVNDVSLHLGVPVVHGSIFRFEGQVSVFEPWVGPCYRCLYREPPPPELAPSCAEAGVLGVLPGVVGSIQAMEAIKLILGIGDTLTGRLMMYDALEQDFTTMRVNRNPECPACGDPNSLPAIVDYDETCRVPA
ncbi:MAG: molybdopterin-synthase adenylyltransferase MoeB [Acidimicrobiia bacterium]|jgi:molybdopterin/thiamine biosynthesis adenylyltransferase/rhodanese-related sulfurtransferase